MSLIASVAVDAATFAIDKLYDYAVPSALEAGTVPGVRVKVPFSGGNRVVEGFVFAVREALPLIGFDRPEALDGSVWSRRCTSSLRNG